MSPNRETWLKLTVLVLSLPLAVYLVTQGVGDPRWGLLFIVAPVVLVASLLVMFIAHLVREREYEEWRLASDAAWRGEFADANT